jgi:hypothetical protein
MDAVAVHRVCLLELGAPEHALAAAAAALAAALLVAGVGPRQAHGVVGSALGRPAVPPAARRCRQLP